MLHASGEALSVAAMEPWLQLKESGSAVYGPASLMYLDS